MNIGFVEALVSAAVLAIPVAAYARYKGRDPVNFYLLAFFLLVPVAAYAMWMKPKHRIEPGTVVRLRGGTTFKDGTSLPKQSEAIVLAVDRLDGKQVVYLEFDGYQGWLPTRSVEAAHTIEGLTLVERIFDPYPEPRPAES